MKRLCALLIIFNSFGLCYAQKHTPLPHGMVFGAKPGTIGQMKASQLESFMGKRTRTSAVIIGTVVYVTKPKGGWFTLDAGNGKTIAAHFKNAGITLPPDVKGREVIIEGVAQKQFIADDLQPLAGQTKTQLEKQHYKATSPSQRITFEVKGLFVNR